MKPWNPVQKAVQYCSLHIAVSQSDILITSVSQEKCRALKYKFSRQLLDRLHRLSNVLLCNWGDFFYVCVVCMHFVVMMAYIFISRKVTQSLSNIFKTSKKSWAAKAPLKGAVHVIALLSRVKSEDCYHSYTCLEIYSYSNNICPPAPIKLINYHVISCLFNPDKIKV